MARILKMDIAHLEEEELAYEQRIRTHYGQPAHAIMMSEMGKLAHWMEYEKSNGIAPKDLAHGISEDGIQAELNLCEHQIGGIYDAVTEKFVDNETLDETLMGEASTLASRITHYDIRTRRMDRAQLTADQQTVYDNITQRAASTRAILLGVIPPTPATSTANTTGETTRTSHATTSEHELPPNANHVNGPPPATTTPPGPRLNSTVHDNLPNGLPTDQGPLFNMSNQSDRALYDAATEVRRRSVLEGNRRATEYLRSFERVNKQMSK